MPEGLAAVTAQAQSTSPWDRVGLLSVLAVFRAALGFLRMTVSPGFSLPAPALGASITLQLGGVNPWSYYISVHSAVSYSPTF